MESVNLKDMRFDSYNDLLTFIKSYERKNFVQLNRVYTKKLTAECVLKKYPVKMKTVNNSLVYYNLTYMCVNGGSYKYAVLQKRKSSTSKLGCPMFMRFRLSADGQRLEMADYTEAHNHIINREVFNMLPKERRLNEDEKQEAQKFIKLKCNKKMIKHYIKANTGKIITLKDLSNLKMKMKNLKDENELISAVEFLKTDPEADVEILVNANNELEGLYFQDKYMKKSYESYPEVLLCDATYKLNMLRIPLYTLLVINGNGNGEVAGTFLLVNENENSLSEMIKHFKEKNSDWQKTISILTDKDLKERHVFEKEFPNAQLLLCLFHTLKTFRTAITSQKMNINSDDRDKCLNIIQKLAYSKNEDEYQKHYEKLLQLNSEKVINYYNTNWHNIRNEWVEGMKKQNLTLNLSTTNHLESLNQKIKQVVTKMSDLRSFYSDFLILLETIRDEYKNTAANMATKKLVHSYEKDSAESKYIELLTPYAFTFVEKNLRNYKTHGNDQNWNTTQQECNCIFRKNMKLPCVHIFYQRTLSKSNLYDENLVEQRYKKMYYITHNTTSNSYNISSYPDSISINKIINKKPQTSNEKYRKTMELVQQIASCSSELGSTRYEKLMEELTKLLTYVKQGKDVLVSEETVLAKDIEKLKETACYMKQPNNSEQIKINFFKADQLDTISLNEESVGAMVVIKNKTEDENYSEEIGKMSVLEELDLGGNHDKDIKIVPFSESTVASENKIFENCKPAVISSLTDHTYYCKDKILGELRANGNFNDLKEIKYKHLKMKRIGRPKGSDNTVIGIRKRNRKDTKDIK